MRRVRIIRHNLSVAIREFGERVGCRFIVGVGYRIGG